MTREVSWGDGLVVAAYHTAGGLQAAVDAITAEVGVMAGTRNTFGRLLRVPSPEELSPRNKGRAWLLLAALGQNPPDWGVSDDSAPGSGDAEALKARLRARVRREGLEPPTRCVELEPRIAGLRVRAPSRDQVADVIPFPLWKTGRSPSPVLPRRVPLTLVPTTAVA